MELNHLPKHHSRCIALSGGSCREISEEEFLAGNGFDFAWLHLDGVELQKDHHKLSKQFHLCELTLEDALNEHSRSGLEQQNGKIAFIAESVRLEDDRAVYQNIAFFFDAKSLVTLSVKKSSLLHALQSDFLADPEDFGDHAGEIVASVVDGTLDGFFPVVDFYHDKIEALEDSIFAGNLQQSGKALEIKRELLVLRKRIAPLRDNLNSISRYAAPVVRPEDGPYFNDLYNHCLRLVENIDLGRDILSTIMDVQLNLVNTRLNEIVRVLTVISTLMMACSLIAGIYGMNFKHMPELDAIYGYPLALAGMVLVCVVILAVFRKKKWI